ncbi:MULTISPECIES: hypothetical protein [unclassified Pseudomonas]|uniref:hypothetical protein n=1 Tax=unclassified Pseudomonas TaxID=196821 RepID=UPI00129D93A2|nr:MULTISPECIES: hypothetical protein [unclassified Pseudomonas]MDH4653796.1 hypothetical protein [Pseudomonas sp. BN606]MRK22730.1 hypothetical protein [Pseudomonas sp. JG-B]
MRVHALLRAKPIVPQHISLKVERSPPSLEQRQLRQMLQQEGLKTSMPRLKVLEILCQVFLEGDDIPSRFLHERLVDAGEPLSLVSVRLVLGRMVDSGLVAARGGSRYCLAPAWEASILAQRPRSSPAA